MSLVGVGIGPPGDAAKPVIRETATLFGIVLTAGAGLILGQIDTNRPLWLFIVAFDLVTVASLLGMVVIVMAKDKRGCHLYDWASIRYTQVTGAVTILFAVMLTGQAIAGGLPWQSFAFETRAPLGEPYREVLLDKTEALVVPVALNNSLFLRGVPAQLLMSITLRDDLSKHWRVAEVRGLVGSPSEREPMRPEPIDYTPKEGKRPNQWVWYLNELKDGKAYTLDIALVPNGRADFDALRKAIQDRGMTVIFHSKEKSKQK